jgi:hypothetical protein
VGRVGLVGRVGPVELRKGVRHRDVNGTNARKAARGEVSFGGAGSRRASLSSASEISMLDFICVLTFWQMGNRYGAF